MVCFGGPNPQKGHRNVSRPKTKGPPIQFRLPLDTHNRITTKANTKHQTIAEYCANLIIGATK